MLQSLENYTSVPSCFTESSDHIVLLCNVTLDHLQRHRVLLGLWQCAQIYILSTCSGLQQEMYIIIGNYYSTPRSINAAYQYREKKGMRTCVWREMRRERYCSLQQTSHHHAPVYNNWSSDVKQLLLLFNEINNIHLSYRSSWLQTFKMIKNQQSADRSEDTQR